MILNKIIAAPEQEITCLRAAKQHYMDGHVENSINLTTILIAEKSIQHVKEELETTSISKLNAVFAII